MGKIDDLEFQTFLHVFVRFFHSNWRNMSQNFPLSLGGNFKKIFKVYIPRIFWRSKLQSSLEPSKVGYIMYIAHNLQVQDPTKTFPQNNLTWKQPQGRYFHSV